MKTCIRCGKKTEKTIDGFCEKCFVEHVLKIKLPEKIKIKKCKRCGKVLIKNKLMNIEDVVEKKLSKMFSKVEGIESVRILKINGKIEGSYTRKLKGIKQSIDFSIDLEIENFVCDLCQRRFGKEFNSVLQIRGKNIENIINKIDNFLKKIEEKRADAFISKLEKVKNGIDIYFYSKNISKKIANFLKKNQKVKIKITRKLYGIKNGKKKYKDTILVRICEKEK